MISTYELAVHNSYHAYAPYSNYKVGATILWSNQTISSGFNIENSSYGATICAERVAICKGYYSGLTIDEIVFYPQNATDFCLPCGICLQMISEFATPDTEITCIVNKNNIIQSKTVYWRDLNINKVAV